MYELDKKKLYAVVVKGIYQNLRIYTFLEGKNFYKICVITVKMKTLTKEKKTRGSTATTKILKISKQMSLTMGKESKRQNKNKERKKKRSEYEYV